MEKENPTSAPRLPFRRTVDPKLQGELIELAFLHKAVSLGFAVAKPYGDSERYDFIVDYRDSIDRKLLRVQVKSTALLHQGCYRIWCAHTLTRRSRAAYSTPQNPIALRRISRGVASDVRSGGALPTCAPTTNTQELNP
jgi:hypothetical protein